MITSPVMPNSVAIVRAVAAWSPVIIFTSIPALRHRSIANRASGRGGSAKPTSPSKHSCWIEVRGSVFGSQSEWAMRRDATARTRKPRSPSASFVVRTMLRPAGSSGAHVPSPAAVLAQWVSSTSGAPLT